MQPTVELRRPARLNKAGVVYKRGVEVPVDIDTAVRLATDDRFRVRGLGDRAAVEEMRNRKPQGKELLRAIHNAIADLDEDDDENYDRNGKASATALTRALGYSISPQGRDAAIEYGASRQDEQDEAEPQSDLLPPPGDKPAGPPNLNVSRKAKPKAEEKAEDL